ncbi:MAG: heavy metal-associated domain-containing protein [Faecalibacillus intestinalis]
MKYKYKVNGLDCANCTQKLEDALNKKEEINDCVISFATGMMTFESNQEINDNELLSFIQSIEDEVTIDNLSTNKTHHGGPAHHHDECGVGTIMNMNIITMNVDVDTIMNMNIITMNVDADIIMNMWKIIVNWLIQSNLI